MDRSSLGPVNLDDPTYIASIVSNWYRNDKATTQPRLRGGQREVSQTWSEVQVEIQDEDVAETTSSKHQQTVDEEATEPPNAKVPSVVKIESPDVKLEAIPRYVPLEEHEISRASYGPRSKPSPVISIAHENTAPLQQHVISSSVHELDDEPKTNPFTSTQLKVMQKVAEDSRADDKPASITPEIQKSTPQASAVSKKGISDVAQTAYTGPLGFCELIAQEHARKTELKLQQQSSNASADIALAQQPKSSLNPVAEEFKTSVSSHSEESQQQPRVEVITSITVDEVLVKTSIAEPVLESLPTGTVSTAETKQAEQQAAAPVIQKSTKEQDLDALESEQTKTPAEDLDELRSEGGLDITPMLKALGARLDTGSPAVSIKGTDLEDRAPNSSSKHEDGKESSKPQSILGDDNKAANSELSCQDETQYKARTVLLTQLPSDIDYSALTSLVSGGRLENMQIERNTSSACVTFVEGVDAYTFAQSRTSGILLKYHGQVYKLSVELLSEVNSPDPILQAYHSCGATRVVEVENMMDEYGIVALHKLATGLFGRQVESVVDSYKSTRRVTTFRFSGVQDAVNFRNMLSNSKEWKKHVISFGDDPCDKSC